MSLLRTFSTSDAYCSTVSMLLRASHACPCLINCLSTVRHFAAQAEFAHGTSSDEEEWSIAVSNTQQRPAPAATGGLRKLVWQGVAGLSVQQAQQLLHQQPHLEQILQTEFHHSNLAGNLKILRDVGLQISQPVSQQLRAYLSLVPPGRLHDMVHSWGDPGPSHLLQAVDQLCRRLAAESYQKQQQLAQQQERQLRWQHWQAAHVADSLIPVLECVSQQRQLLQLQQRQVASPMQQVAAAVTDALGLRDQPVPEFIKLDEDVQIKAARQISSATTHSSSNSSSSSQPSRSSRRRLSQCQSSSVRDYQTAAAITPTCDRVLAIRLERTGNAVHLKSKGPPSPAASAEFAQQLQRHGGLAPLAAFELLYKRPAVFWASPPGTLLQLLQQRLPGLSTAAAVNSSTRKQQEQQSSTVLAQMLVQHPNVLEISTQQAAEVLDLLLQRLRLTPAEAVAAIAANPRLLLNPVKEASLVLGFLVGLGFRPAELKAMAVRDPTWMTRRLKDVTLNWRFVSSAAKATLADVVLFPELLSLPITTKMGPRIAYARKRGVKLLMPSYAALLPALTQQQRRDSKLMPLEMWLTKSDKFICNEMGLNLDDFSRFKFAWIRVDGVAWKQASKTGNIRLALK